MPVNHPIHGRRSLTIENIQTHHRCQSESDARKHDGDRKCRWSAKRGKVVNLIGGDHSAQTDGERDIKYNEKSRAEQRHDAHRKWSGIAQFSEDHSHNPNGREEDGTQHQAAGHANPGSLRPDSQGGNFLESDPVAFHQDFSIFVRQQRECRCGLILFPIKSRRNGHPFFATKPVGARRKGIRGKCQLFYSCQPIERIKPLVARADDLIVAAVVAL